jgi:hypothetical protein
MVAQQILKLVPLRTNLMVGFIHSEESVSRKTRNA